MIMARKLDRILVVDVEATCWEGDPPSGQTSEIIEIGLCVLDVPTLARVEQRAILVRPGLFDGQSLLHPVDHADPGRCGWRHAAGGGLSAFLCTSTTAPARLWASYGDYDRKQFERNCGEFGIPYPFGPTHLNVKTLVAVACGWSREVGMSEALKRMGLPLEGTHHRGGDDAWNIAAILSRVLRSSRVG